MKAIVAALAPVVQASVGIDVSDRAADLERRLDNLDESIAGRVKSLPPSRRRLVTGHESLGYFAQRYGFRLVGAVVPSLSTEAESSAAELSALEKLITAEQVPVIFTELGTPKRTVDALARDTGARVVPLATHSLPEDRSYFTFEEELADVIISALGE
jgi:zinc/manganese transport system substrate-binding protein